MNYFSYFTRIMRRNAIVRRHISSMEGSRMEEYLRFMNIAYQEALKALDEGEVPVGAVVVRDGQVIGRGYNRIEKCGDATAHAEIIAIGAASDSAGSWRLNGCTLYVTLEPCIMCLGAIMQSRIDAVVYGATDPRFGALRSDRHRDEIERAYRRFPLVVPGVLERPCGDLLTSFFAGLRKKN